jgi:hypothetical protein
MRQAVAKGLIGLLINQAVVFMITLEGVDGMGDYCLTEDWMLSWSVTGDLKKSEEKSRAPAFLFPNGRQPSCS